MGVNDVSELLVLPPSNVIKATCQSDRVTVAIFDVSLSIFNFPV